MNPVAHTPVEFAVFCMVLCLVALAAALWAALSRRCACSDGASPLANDGELISPLELRADLDRHVGTLYSRLAQIEERMAPPPPAAPESAAPAPEVAVLEIAEAAQ